MPPEEKNFKIEELYFYNINKECDEYTENPYCPESKIIFKNMTSRFLYSRQGFENAKINVKNRTGKDIDYIKFRLILTKDKYESVSDAFFNQTIESNKKIFKGDNAEIDIPALEKYYTSFNIQNFAFGVELIEIRPKPESEDCKIIEELKGL